MEERSKRCSTTEEEKAFLHGSKFPVRSLTSLMTQWGGTGATLTSLTECTEIISMEKTSDFLRDILVNALPVLKVYEVLKSIQRPFRNISTILSRIARTLITSKIS